MPLLDFFSSIKVADQAFLHYLKGSICSSRIMIHNLTFSFTVGKFVISSSTCVQLNILYSFITSLAYIMRLYIAKIPHSISERPSNHSGCRLVYLTDYWLEAVGGKSGGKVTVFGVVGKNVCSFWVTLLYYWSRAAIPALGLCENYRNMLYFNLLYFLAQHLNLKPEKASDTFLKLF